MRAAWYEKNGPAHEVLKVGDIPDVTPLPGEVRVRLKASAVNPSDVKARTGARPIRWPQLIPHSDGAGIIDAVGKGCEHRLGERVWVFNGQWDRAFGTAAEAITLASALAQPLPLGVSFEAGACLGIPVMTAHRALFADGSIAGKTVWVSGGAGVVGHYAIQLAKWAGARVVTTVSNAAKATLALTAGADVVINYHEQDVVETIKRTVGGVDRIVEVDFGRNLPHAVQVLNDDAVIACYASSSIPRPVYPYPDLLWRNPQIRQVFVYTMAQSAKDQAHQDIALWLKQTSPIFSIAHRFALSDIVKAHEVVESGQKMGHVLLTID